MQAHAKKSNTDESQKDVEVDDKENKKVGDLAAPVIAIKKSMTKSKSKTSRTKQASTKQAKVSSTKQAQALAQDGGAMH